MFPEWTERKRGRDDDLEDYDNGTGFAEHRTKRRLANLPHRTSPNFNRNPTPPIFTIASYGSPTPADSAEQTPQETKSFFSPYSSPPEDPFSQYASPDILLAHPPSQASYNTNVDMDMSEDTDMDYLHLSPTETSPSISSRIPTPIHSSFARSIRSEKAAHPASSSEDTFADDEALINRFKRGRRLPSPISEGEMSPSVLVDGMEDMQMEVDRASEPPMMGDLTTPTKKGHQRSKHSVRQWSGYGGDLQSAGQGVRRSFSMGYRADCDKCRLKVPGHFSHIITYGD